MGEWSGIIAASVLLIGLAVAGSYLMKVMQRRHERGNGDSGPNYTGTSADDTSP